MKKKQSPIELSNLFFTDYTWWHLTNPSFRPEDLHFDLRHDFLIDKNFAGIATELHFFKTNDNRYNGVRRKVSVLLFDATDRVLISTKRITMRITQSDSYCRKVVAFPLEETEFRSGHAFRLQVRDDNADQLLGEGCFRTYMDGQFGDPSTWYKPVIGGLIPDGESEMMKSFDPSTRENRICCIRFEVCDALRTPHPDTMPELEVRIYYPIEEKVFVDFIEPRNAYRGDHTCIVDLPFHAPECCGVYYVELLCMDTPIAGFVFTTDRDIEGHWINEGLAPLDEYDYAAANRRYNESLPDDDELEEIPTDQDFDALLDAFIAHELKEAAPSDSSDSSENSENSDDSEDSDFSTSSILHEEPILNTDAEHPILDDEHSLLSELDDLTGLRAVKDKIITYDKIMRFCMLRAAKGLELFHSPLHAMFLGSPGTGKTTVARLMGRMLKKAGILSRGHVVMKERSTLIGKYYNSEAENTLEAIELAQGGILFIDEAHSLFQPNDPKDPGKFVIEALLTALADPDKDDWMLILAGYPDEMKRLFELNPGFKSRIPDSNIYTFDDFSEEELMEIAERRIQKLDFTLSPEAREALRRRLSDDYVNRDRNFGNARHVMNLIHTEILPAMAVRVMDAELNDRQSLSEIHPSDIPVSTPKATSRRKPVGFTFSSAS
ncbi:MAG: AAA family ATPase [Muribaculaceae bacterium]|nr:AAA family ATPase [Muribaculaceae bacterium]